MDWQKSKRLEIYTVDVTVRIAGGNARWCNFIWRGIWQYLVKLCILLPYDPATTLLEICFKIFWQNMKKEYPMLFIICLFIIAKTGNNPNFV